MPQLTLPPLSLYVHIPWCVKKCPYCDFNSHTANNQLPEEEYLQALIQDLELELPYVQGRKLSSIFFGGGTPSLFSAETIGRIIQAAKRRIGFEGTDSDNNIEITLEANPGTFEQEKFSGYRSVGVNRLSIGIQSFNNNQLEALGRIHSSEQAINAFQTARKAGFENINLDLMFGLPEQKKEDCLTDLEVAVEQSPTHISWYQLTIEPNTVFYSKPPITPDDDKLFSMQEGGQSYLEKMEYKQYEISAYAKDKYVSLHNTNYWQFGDYLGIGAGAHGKITNVAEGNIARFSRHKIPKRYIELAGSDAVITETRKLNRNDLALEFMMNALRLKEGVDSGLFLRRTGLPLSIIEKELMQAVDSDLIEWQIDNQRPTKKGQSYLNELLEIFVK